MRITRLRANSLYLHNWEIQTGESWCVIGGNASGKGLLASVLTGELDPGSGEIDSLPSPARCVSFEQQHAVYEEQLRNDNTDFIDRLDTGSTGLEVLQQSGCSRSAAIELADRMGVRHILGRGYRLLSSGEARKLLLLKEILADPAMLILDEPFEGLDPESRDQVNDLASSLAQEGHLILLLVNRLDDVPDWTTHLGILQQGELIATGRREKIASTPELHQLFAFNESAVPELPSPLETGPIFDPILELSDGKVQYGDTLQFSGFDWILRSGEHTLITGPNGAGKSTLLQLVSGDHPQCYCNDLKLLGFQRGTGESVWEIKRHIGLVSASLHRDYRAPGNARTTVVSGFFDSIGLYQKPNAQQLKLAAEWLSVMGLEKQANTSFRQLSWGQQRMVLIARGLIKHPALMILDEPTQGLDDLNRHLVLAFIQRLADLKRTTFLFVSHREDEHLPLFKRRIVFRKMPTGTSPLFAARWK